MSDAIIFFMGCFVSLVVASAVGLLLWGAANEPRGTIFPTKEPRQSEPEPRSDPTAPATAKGTESESLA